MSSNEPQYVVCSHGVFTLPESIYKSLAMHVARNNFVYLREDDDVLTISATRIDGGRRRLMNSRFRAPMFRDAKVLAIIDYRESLRIIAVEKR